MKTILVTGATGYIGARLCLYLKKCGYEVIGLCRYIPESKKEYFSGIKIIENNLIDLENYDEVFLNPVHIVIHTISLDSQKCESSDIETINNVNVKTTWKLIDKSIRSGVEKFIYLSTIQVLGRLKSGTFKETDPLFPENKYALTHSICENLLKYYGEFSKMKCIIARLSNGYGAPIFEDNNCWQLVINDFCRAAFKAKKITMNSSGTVVRDFIHVADIVKALEILVYTNDLNYSIYQISSGKTSSLSFIAELVMNLHEKRYGSKVDFSISKKASLNKESFDFKIDNSRLIQTGYFPEFSLEKGINELFSFLERVKNESEG
jgi:nucleoside-diphosphate-sugar epimerase